MCDDDEDDFETYEAVEVPAAQIDWVTDPAWWIVTTASEMTKTFADQLDSLSEIIGGHLNYRKAERERKAAAREAAEAMGLIDGKEPR